MCSVPLPRAATGLEESKAESVYVWSQVCTVLWDSAGAGCPEDVGGDVVCMWGGDLSLVPDSVTDTSRDHIAG